MHDLTPFEQELADRLAAELARSSASYDPARIAATAMVRRTSLDQLRNRVALGPLPVTSTARRVAVVGLIALLALAAAAIFLATNRSAGPPLALVTTDFDVLVANADGSGQRLVGRVEPSALWLKLAWAPDGTHLAFMGDDWQLTVIDPMGDVAFRRTLEQGFSKFTWSPRGDRLAIFDGPWLTGEDRPTGDGFAQVHPHLDIISSDGREATTVALPDAFRYVSGQGDVAWSPDGRSIAITGFLFTRQHSFYPSSLWIVDTATWSVREVVEERDERTRNFRPQNFRPTWLPNGRLLVSRPGSGIWEVDPTTGATSQLFEFGPRSCLDCPPVDFVDFMAPSPDGTRVAFFDPGRGLGILDVGTGVVSYPPFPGRIWTPVRWTADGTRVALLWGPMTDPPGLPTKLATLDIESGEVSVVATDVRNFDLRSN